MSLRVALLVLAACHPETGSSGDTSGPTDTGTPIDSAPAADPALCKLARQTDWLGLGFPLHPYSLPSVGTLRVVVLYVDFPDAVAVTPVEDVDTLVEPAAVYSEVVSGDRLDVEYAPHLAWLRMSQPAEAYGMNDGVLDFEEQLALVSEAVAAADPAVDFFGADAVFVVGAPEAPAIDSAAAMIANPGGGVVADGQVIDHAVTAGFATLDYWGPLLMSHEGSHMLGLADLYLYAGATPEEWHAAVGGLSLMGWIGGEGPELFAWERWVLGWIDDEQVECVPTGPRRVELTAIEAAGGTKAVVVPTGATTAVVVESRRAQGYDAALTEPGAVVYTVDTARETGEFPLVVQPKIDGDPYRTLSPLGVGESVTVGEVTVTVVASDDETDTVKVTIGGAGRSTPILPPQRAPSLPAVPPARPPSPPTRQR